MSPTHWQQRYIHEYNTVPALEGVLAAGQRSGLRRKGPDAVASGFLGAIHGLIGLDHQLVVVVRFVPRHGFRSRKSTRRKL